MDTDDHNSSQTALHRRNLFLMAGGRRLGCCGRRCQASHCRQPWPGQSQAGSDAATR